MDGDIRARRPRAPTTGDSWGYSTVLSPQLVQPGFGSYIPAQADATPARPIPAQRRHRGDDQAKPDAKPDAKDDKSDDKSDDKDKAAKKPPMPRWKKLLYALIGLVILAALIVAGVLYWLHARHFESTDDAFVDGHMSQISAQVAARVIRLDVKDNQEVAAGQVLMQLDPRDFQVKVDQAQAQQLQAEAQLKQQEAQLSVLSANMDQAQAQVRVAQADLGQQQTDLNRYRAIDPKAITRQQLDTSSAQTKSAGARVDAQKQAVEAAQAQMDAQRATIEASRANLQAARVAVENAALQLSYTQVKAPEAGRVTKRTAEVGNYVNPGQALLAIVPDDFWVTANFKETQLALMRAQQPVRIEVDACPDQDIEAHVDSFQSGTGAVFSSLPAENATGNYVKVVQRVPVKIVFNGHVDGCRLFPGLSVTPRVTVR